MQVRDAMSDDVQIASPNQSIRDAAILMAKIDAGVLPVGENDRLVGMITDRDIAVRAIALGKGPDTKVRDVMSGLRRSADPGCLRPRSAGNRL
jgi:CBS domain-containing protein